MTRLYRKAVLAAASKPPEWLDDLEAEYVDKARTRLGRYLRRETVSRFRVAVDKMRTAA